MRPSITAREQQVLIELCRGVSNKQIAVDLGISEQAVKAHVSRLFVKFGVENRAGLATAAANLLSGDAAIEAARDAASARADVDEENRQLARSNARLTTENQHLRDANAKLRHDHELPAVEPRTSTRPD